MNFLQTKGRVCRKIAFQLLIIACLAIAVGAQTLPPQQQGNPTSGTVSNGTRTTTILQPVPLGNPASNSDPVRNTNTQPNVVPVSVAPTTTTTTTIKPN